MYSEFNQFSFLGMSNSELFLLKEGKKETEFQVFSVQSTSEPESPEGCQLLTASNNIPKLDDEDLKKEDKCEAGCASNHHSDQDKKDEQYCDQSTPIIFQPSLLGQLNTSTTHDEDEDEDGFRTPTSLDHKLPPVTQCPPAPRKLRPPPSSTKRKASPEADRSIHLDLSEDVDSMFPPILQDDIGRNIKKARIRDHSG